MMYLKNSLPKCCVIVGVVIAGAAPAFGQWVEQTYPLQAGWNSIYLEVDPAPEQADLLFAGLPIASVWWRTLEPAAGLGEGCDGPDDPDCTPPHDTLWRMWRSSGQAGPIVNNLRLIRGGRVYHIEATEPFVLTVVGIPAGRLTQWRSGFNLAGFNVDPGAAPTFQTYLASSPLHSDVSIYQLQNDGSLGAVEFKSLIEPGRGYWVSAQTDGTFSGPLSIDPTTLRGIDFGKRRYVHRITVENLASDPRDITVSYVPSAPVPNVPELPINAGDVPVHWLDYGGGSEPAGMLQWSLLSSRTFELPAAPAPVSSTFTVGVRRAGLAEASLDAQTNLGSQYEGVLELRDGAGFRRYVRVAAQVLGGIGAPAAGGGGITPRPGLYLGTVVVDQVSWVTAGAPTWTNDDPNDPQFAALLRCVGGDNDTQTCFPDRDRCVGTPEIELNNIVCEQDDDCPEGGNCATITDCPGGNCAGFCIGGDSPDAACGTSGDCEGDGGVCSADVDTAALRPTPVSFEFPVILHLSDLNEYKLLIEVTLLKDDDDVPVLATPDCDPAFCETLRGALIVNGQPFARRVSTAAFSFEHDLLLTGAFDSSLIGQTTVAADDPLNPYRHKFHPDHDCDQSGECMEIERSLVFDFEPEPPKGQSTLDWGDSVLGGVYTEQVSGLHRGPIASRGRFELRRVSEFGVLNAPVKGGASK